MIHAYKRNMVQVGSDEQTKRCGSAALETELILLNREKKLVLFSVRYKLIGQLCVRHNTGKEITSFGQNF